MLCEVYGITPLFPAIRLRHPEVRFTNENEDVLFAPGYKHQYIGAESRAFKRLM